MTHMDGGRLIRGDPDAGQLRTELKLVRHLAGDGPEEVSPRLAIDASSRLATFSFVFKLLISFVDIAFEKAMNSFTSCKPFFVTMQKEK